MSRSLVGRRVLVSGGSRGLGLELAKKFLAEGARVVIVARDHQLLSKVTEENGFEGFAQGDVADPEIAEAVVAEAANILGGIDYLICNAGSGKSVPAGTETYGDWQATFLTNFYTTTNMVRSSESYLEESAGVVVCISSICGTRVIHGAPLTYSVAKAALNAFVKAAAWPLSRKKIRIVGVVPGNLLFPGSVWEDKLTESPEAVNAMLSELVPTGELGTAEDVADLVAFLVSDSAKFITGSLHTIDGGQSAI